VTGRGTADSRKVAEVFGTAGSYATSDDDDYVACESCRGTKGVVFSLRHVCMM
jgi:hypothetical protein